MKVSDVLESVPALNKIMASPMSPRLAFRLGRLMKALNEVLDSYEAARKALIQDFSANGRVKDGKIADAHVQHFMALMEPVLADDVSVVIPVVTLTDLGTLNMTPADMMRLSWLIQDDEPALAR